MKKSSSHEVIATAIAMLVAMAAFSQNNVGDNLSPQEIAKKTLDTYAALSSYTDTGTTIESKGGESSMVMFSIRMQRPNLFKVHWLRVSGNQTNEGTWWFDGHPAFSSDDTYLLTETNGQPTNSQPQIIGMPFALTAVDESSAQATIVPRIFFELSDWRASALLALVANGKLNGPGFKIELNEQKAAAVDCYVISITNIPLIRSSIHLGKTITRLWIGKQDFLLHQVQSLSGTQGVTMTQKHEGILINQNFSVSDFQWRIPESKSSITLHSAPPAALPAPR